MKNNIKEIIVATCLVVITILLLNPLRFWMPDMMVILMLALALIIFGIFATFILRERIFDERDGIHRTLAGRNAFLVGSAVLMLGILVQGYSHSIDPWLVIALILMIIVKITTRIWSDKNL
ncbi:MAG: hypothetical protein P4L63_03220 [Candidatus Pacebacteria bacterium]|nr:hypothetical protein [Candidatus Paceibacterota bacterium]